MKLADDALLPGLVSFRHELGHEQTKPLALEHRRLISLVLSLHENPTRRSQFTTVRSNLSPYMIHENQCSVVHHGIDIWRPCVRIVRLVNSITHTKRGQENPRILDALS
jgi:hypothetical protein